MRPTLLLLLAVASAAVTFSLTAHAAAAAPGHHHAASCLPLERDALLEFKRAITSDPAGHLASWQEGEGDCCRWRGVRCSNQTGHVLGLHLRNLDTDGPSSLTESLTGQISPSLLSLQHLEHLDLSMNNLSGPAGRVPEFLGLLKNLRYLNLSNLPFSGRVPPQLGNLSRLHYLDLSRNEYLYILRNTDMYSTDISWLSNLPLQYLNLGSVNLSGAADWAHAVNMVPSLKVLRLSACSLVSANQSLPHLNLTNLVELSLSSNDLFLSPIASCWFWNLTSLQQLELWGTSLYGQIPDALGRMTSLRVLDLSYIRFGNIMTANMRNLCNLEILDLTYNELSGNIMELLPHCSTNKLKELHLSHNNFTGVLPNRIGRLWSDLLVLELRGNRFDGYVPTEIGMLGNLNIMDLSSNNLTGVITHQHFTNLTRLTILDLSDNLLKIIVDPEWFPPFVLEKASLASCQMGNLFPAWLHTQTDIIYLNISGASIVDRLPNWFVTSFSKAVTVDISNNGINGTLPENLEIMTSLQLFYLSSNQLTGPIPQLPISLIEFDISRNSLSGPLPSNFGIQNIQFVSLAHNHISGPIPKSICKLKDNLRYLNLANNLFEGEFPSCFHSRIEILILHDNSLSGKFPSFFKTCTNLNILDLSWNKFSGRLPMWIGNLATLAVLQLSHNKFTGSIPATITRLNGLFQLNLANNILSGPLPRHLSNFTSMKGSSFMYDRFNYEGRRSNAVNLSVITKGQELYYKDIQFYAMVSIDLSRNQLTGGIPGEITALDRIINLNLSWNHLRGEIPNKIGGMSALESLDLKENKIYGDIPQSLTKLTYLEYVDLSYNNLTGRIPSGGQLDTLYAQHPFMYNGNIGLCGNPLHKNCSDNNEPMQGNRRIDEHGSDLMSFRFGVCAGYVVGLWLVFCVILFKKTWRVACFSLFDKAHDKVYVFVAITWARWTEKKKLRLR